MSAAETAWAWRQKTPSPAEKLVLLALADQAGVGKQRHNVAELAETCGLMPDTLIAAVAALQKAELLYWDIGGSSNSVLSLELYGGEA